MEEERDVGGTRLFHIDIPPILDIDHSAPNTTPIPNPCFPHLTPSASTQLSSHLSPWNRTRQMKQRDSHLPLFPLEIVDGQYVTRVSSPTGWGSGVCLVERVVCSDWCVGDGCVGVRGCWIDHVMGKSG